MYKLQVIATKIGSFICNGTIFVNRLCAMKKKPCLRVSTACKGYTHVEYYEVLLWGS